MKGTIYSINGEKKGEIEMPKAFNSKIREDIVLKCVEAEKDFHPYSNYEEAGKRHSASGRLRHIRHKWRSAYGRGISRVPRKTMSRAGTQFNWVGAEVSGTRGGRRPHAPRGLRRERKVNKKERAIALSSVLTASTMPKFVESRYARVDKVSLHLPIVFSAEKSVKTKEFNKFVEKVYGKLAEVAFREKSIRSGKGKLRNRKYKSNAGLLVIEAKDENLKLGNVQVVKANEIRIADLYPLGRLALFTHKAVEELGK